MKAMILAAGRGERMRPLTDHMPKPLLKVGGKALMVWHLERLAHAGFNEIVINHAYLGAQIEASLGNGTAWGVSIQYSAETTALETAGGIAQALPLLGEEPFVVVNGDVYTDYPFSQLRNTGVVPSGSNTENKYEAKLAHLVMVDNPPQHAEGDFALETQPASDGLLVKDHLTPKLTFSGIGVYHPDLFKRIAPATPARLAPILRDAMRLALVSGEHFKGIWFDIGTPERLQQVDALLKKH